MPYFSLERLPHECIIDSCLRRAAGSVAEVCEQFIVLPWLSPHVCACLCFFLFLDVICHHMMLCVVVVSLSVCNPQHMASHTRTHTHSGWCTKKAGTDWTRCKVLQTHALQHFPLSLSSTAESTKIKKSWTPNRSTQHLNTTQAHSQQHTLTYTQQPQTTRTFKPHTSYFSNSSFHIRWWFLPYLMSVCCCQCARLSVCRLPLSSISILLLWCLSLLLMLPSSFPQSLSPSSS